MNPCAVQNISIITVQRNNASQTPATTKRLKVVIHGAVQGVGFRPFVFRLATELGLHGWVINSSQGVFIEAEADEVRLLQFLLRLEKEKPPRSHIQSLESSFLDPVGYRSFEIRESKNEGKATAFVLPDIAVCDECLTEVFDPTDRRYRYPFTNCTNCGPRFTIIEALPYDRAKTTMKKFAMCPACEMEYRNPLDRRFHAQPNACPVCGPHLELWDDRGSVLAKHHDALLQTSEAIRIGKIAAVKGLGGFHLMVDAANQDAVERLREKKHREHKPFALMYPKLESVRVHCRVSPLEERSLHSPESPIVLLERSDELPNERNLPGLIAPGNPYLGVMLPYTPLHHLLMRELGFPIVATSGNLADEPICIDEREALVRLRGIADVFLTHNRPILRHVDDSIVRVMMNRELVMRRARGFAPMPIHLPNTNSNSMEMKRHSQTMLAVGAHLKNTVAMNNAENMFISQHIGDLETEESYRAFTDVIDSFRVLYQVEPQQVIADMHPEYLSTKYAHELTSTVESVQHHYAHIASCMAENELHGSVLGVAWDGTGYGTDDTIWGGEFFLASESSWIRFAHLRPFLLPGGEKAIKEPRRCALGLLYELFGESAFNPEVHEVTGAFSTSELSIVGNMLRKRLNAPVTSSAGRLFDAVAAIVSPDAYNYFEGQAAMTVEFALRSCPPTDEAYAFRFYSDERNPTEAPIVIDWEPMIRSLLEEKKNLVPIPVISAKFHNTLVEMIVAIAKIAEEKRVVISGGCFQNKYLTERTVFRLQQEGFPVYWHQRVPPNDGGISLGQLYAGLHRTKEAS